MLFTSTSAAIAVRAPAIESSARVIRTERGIAWLTGRPAKKGRRGSTVPTTLKMPA